MRRELFGDVVMDPLRAGTLNSWVSSHWVSDRIRMRLVRRLGGVSVSRTATITSNVTLYGDLGNLTVGHEVFINHGCVLDMKAAVSIGAYTAVGSDTLIATGSHDIGPSWRRSLGNTSAPVVIGRGVWVGARSVVLPGSVVNDGVVIAAGSVVRGECVANGLYAGVPGRLKRMLDS